MAIFLNTTLTLTPSFSHYPNPKKPHKLPIFSCRATAAAGTSSSSTAAATDFYKILSLKPQESDIEVIKKAYRIMALKYHPDVCSNDDQNCTMSKEESTRKFLQVHAAYKTLSDPVLREEYDNYGFGFKGFRGSTMADFDDFSVKQRWRDQLTELKRKSTDRTAKNGSSWASRMRSQNSNN